MAFRLWLQEKYYHHKDECESWHSIPENTVKDYFNKYKWWLKREYRHQMQKEINKSKLDINSIWR